MRIYVGADHRGFKAKSIVIDYLKNKGFSISDVSEKDYNPEDDFPIIAIKATNKVLSTDAKESRAILICGSGQGMVMAANRVKGIRAGLGWSVEAARGIRNDEDANVLAIPSEVFDKNKQEGLNIIDTFLNTPFAGAARYNRRNQELDNL
jgi:ribose 5-phosphate isomerase B